MASILLSETLGFCSGVAKAVKLTENICLSGKHPICIGSLIHNKSTVQHLESLGLQTVSGIDELEDKVFDCIITRAHGIPTNELKMLEQYHVPIYDLTCSKILVIHDTMKVDFEDFRKIILVGDILHPEIIALKSLIPETACDVLADLEEFQKYPWDSNKKYSIVFQTTFNEQCFIAISAWVHSILKEQDILIHKTICPATQDRQNSIAELAKISDAVLVIGGKQSSNTTKLCQMASSYCNNVFHIETAEEVRDEWVFDFDKIGITAGASTPDFIIKEVLTKVSTLQENMTSQNIEEMDMETLLNEEELSMKKIRTGAIVQGTVIAVTENEIMVNIGYKADGIVAYDELSNDPSVKPSDICKAGDPIEVFVKKLNDGDGNVTLSLKRVQNLKGWETILEKFENKEKVTAKVVQSVKGGLIAIYDGLRCFVPASQISSRFVKDLEQFVGKEFVFEILEIEKRNKKIILSRRELEKDELKEKLEQAWSKIEVGAQLEGIVRRFTDFGAFVDLGGVDGLIHISELSWGRIKHPSQVLKIGDVVKVEILSADKDKNKISLGYKHNIVNPWDIVSDKYSIGDVIKVKALRIAEFGAFVEIEPGLEGLIHISQLSTERVEKVGDVIQVDHVYEAKILDINSDEKRLALSIRALSEPMQEEGEAEDILE